MVINAEGLLACRRIGRRSPRAFVVLAALALSLVAGVADSATIRLATHDQAPYGTYLRDQSFDGVAVRVMRCALTRMKRDFAIEVYPWLRAQVLAERGEVDGFFPATYKKERLVWAEASDMIAEQKWVWYLPADSKLDPASPDFKATARVGAHWGSNRLTMLEDGKYNVVAHPPTDEQLLLMFTLGRMDAMLGGNLAIAEAMKEHNIAPSRFRQVIERDAPLYAYFGRNFLKSEPGFMPQFNKQIAYCR